MTQGELAKLLCGKKSLVSNYENGYSTPDIYTLCRLADIFGITLDELVEWESDGSLLIRLLPFMPHHSSVYQKTPAEKNTSAGVLVEVT